MQRHAGVSASAAETTDWSRTSGRPRRQQHDAGTASVPAGLASPGKGGDSHEFSPGSALRVRCALARLQLTHKRRRAAALAAGLLRCTEPLDPARQSSRRSPGNGKDQDRRVGRIRLYGRRPRPPRRPASEHRDRGAHRQYACRQGDGRGLSALLHARPAEAGRMGEGRLEGPRRGLLRAAARHHAGDHRGGARRQPEREGHRHVGRLPAARHEDLRGMVRPRAPRARAAGRGGLRADGDLSREDPFGAARRLPRLLSDGRAARACAARQGRPDRCPTTSSSTPSPALPARAAA